MDRKLRKLVAFVLVCALTVCATCATVSAQTYSTDYPDVYNSGSPLWIHCYIQYYGEYIIVIDPNTHPQSFGFDSYQGYNLINNTGSTIKGRAYQIGGTEGWLCRWQSYYCLQLCSTNGSTGYFDVYITEIYGTTMDLVDLNGDRGNDVLTREEERDGHEAAQTIVMVTIGLCMLMRPWFKFTYRKRGKLPVSVQS